MSTYPAACPEGIEFKYRPGYRMFSIKCFVIFPQYLQARAGTVPEKGNDLFLPSPFWVIIHSLSLFLLLLYGGRARALQS
jgi:hypothetical protein